MIRICLCSIPLLVLACDPPPTDSANPSEAASAAGSAAIPTASGPTASGPTASAAPSASVAPTAAPGATPPGPETIAVPKGESPMPTKEEWAQAKSVNTADEKDRATGCEMKLLREWIGVFCVDQAMLIPHGSLGQSGKDYVTGGREPDLSLRLRKGHIASAQLALINKKGKDAFLYSVWPTTTDGPIVLALQDVRYKPSWPTTDVVPVVSVDAPTERPAEADWMTATQVATSKLPDDRCRILMLHEWVRVQCFATEADTILSGFRNLKDVGEAGVDYFVTSGSLNGLFKFDLRLKPAMDHSVGIVFGAVGENGSFTFKVRWDAGEPAPSVLAIEKAGG